MQKLALKVWIFIMDIFNAKINIKSSMVIHMNIRNAKINIKNSMDIYMDIS